jgi:hypothetical protein
MDLASRNRDIGDRYTQHGSIRVLGNDCRRLMFLELIIMHLAQECSHSARHAASCALHSLPTHSRQLAVDRNYSNDLVTRFCGANEDCSPKSKFKHATREPTC